jgi:hypothetical protein
LGKLDALRSNSLLIDSEEVNSDPIVDEIVQKYPNILLKKIEIIL